HTGQEVMRDRDETLARRFAAAHNAQAAAGTLPTSKPAPAPTAPAEPAKPAMRPGWSKAAQRRAGRTGRSHPLGHVVEAGAGYTIYEDTAFRGRRPPALRGPWFRWRLGPHLGRVLILPRGAGSPPAPNHDGRGVSTHAGPRADGLARPGRRRPDPRADRADLRRGSADR